MNKGDGSVKFFGDVLFKFETPFVHGWWPTEKGIYIQTSDKTALKVLNPAFNPNSFEDLETILVSDSLQHYRHGIDNKTGAVAIPDFVNKSCKAYLDGREIWNISRRATYVVGGNGYFAIFVNEKHPKVEAREALTGKKVLEVEPKKYGFECNMMTMLNGYLLTDSEAGIEVVNISNPSDRWTFGGIYMGSLYPARKGSEFVFPMGKEAYGIAINPGKKTWALSPVYNGGRISSISDYDGYFYFSNSGKLTKKQQEEWVWKTKLESSFINDIQHYEGLVICSGDMVSVIDEKTGKLVDSFGTSEAETRDMLTAYSNMQLLGIDKQVAVFRFSKPFADNSEIIGIKLAV